MSAPTFVMPNDLSDLCRVCLQLPEESQYLDLTTIYDEEDNLTYGECFTVCTHIDLSAGEGVPHHLCKSCGLELQMTYDFYKKIEESKKVIEQCRRQIEEQQKENTQHLLAGQPNNPDTHIIDGSRGMEQLINAKYELSDDDVLPGTSQDMEHNVRVMDQENEENFAVLPNENAEEVSAELDIISKICEEHGVAPDKDDNRTIEEVGENYAATEHVEDNLEIEDYQNLEALDEEAPGNPSTKSSSTFDSTKFEDFMFINGVDFCAKVHRFVPSPTEETVIEEEISQEATDKWLDALTDIETHLMPRETDIESDEYIDVESDELPPPKKHKTNKIKEKDISPNPEDKTVNESSKKTTFCTICQKDFYSFNKLNWHMRIHVKDRKRFVCPVEKCARIFASQRNCDLHYKQFHLYEGLICPICHKKVSVKQTLEVHMRYHTKDYPFQCNLCERKFAQKGHLTQHIEVKHQNIRYICTEPDCDKQFQNSVSLRNHRYTHSIMPFKCNQCDKEYPQKNKLRVHLLNKHKLKYTLDEVEAMRRFNIVRTRHAFVKVQTAAVNEDQVDAD